MKRPILIALFALAVVAPSVRAQPSDDPKLRDRARTFLVLRLTEALDLSDEKALQVSKILKVSEEKRAKLQQQREGLEKQLREALAGSKPDEARIEKLVDQAEKIDEQTALVPGESFQELRKILTVEQQAKLALARPKIHGEIRGAIRRRMMDLRRPGGAAGDERPFERRPGERLRREPAPQADGGE